MPLSVTVQKLKRRKELRQQYHSRRTPNGQFIWDVNKLVERAKDLVVFDLPLQSIAEFNESDYWYEEGTKPTPHSISIHAKLIQEADLGFPIILCDQGRVMDGMHRCCKALIQGHKTIKALQFEKTPEPDYIDVSFDDLPYNDDGQIIPLMQDK